MSSPHSLDATTSVPEGFYPDDTTCLAQVVSRGEWLIDRQELLANEIRAARLRDAVDAQRRRLPMIKLDKGYDFAGPGGTSTLLDLFDGLRRLLVCHFMLDGDECCSSCSAAAEEVSAELLARLQSRDTSFVAVSRAPLAQIEEYKRRRGWVFPWYSCSGSDFAYDFHSARDDSAMRMAGNDRDGSRMFHTYSMFARRAETLGNWCYWLDLTAHRSQGSRV
ncbi:DUF899 family protein [Nocardia sp. CA-128927]|uniref:DUF899 family protein n=1 Tax=Nocardia sp. CA-128927 TaxID=3239975 RepID=UPI003D97C139